MSKADHDWTPTMMWKLDSAHHGVSNNTHTLYAYLHDATLVNGPTYSPGGVPIGAVEFKGKILLHSKMLCYPARPRKRAHILAGWRPYWCCGV
jgi:hypothetical protein